MGRIYGEESEVGVSLQLKQQQLLAMAQMFGVDLPERKKHVYKKPIEIQSEDSKEYYIERARLKRERKARNIRKIEVKK